MHLISELFKRPLRGSRKTNRASAPRLAARFMTLALLAPLTACAPWPHVEYEQPDIVGRVVDNGKPVPEADVFLGAKPGLNEPCSEVGERVAVSAVDGSFRIAGRSSTVLMRSWLNPASQTGRITAVCIRRPQAGVQIGALIMMFMDQPMSISMECDLSNKSVAKGDAQIASPLGQTQHCRAVRSPRDTRP